MRTITIPSKKLKLYTLAELQDLPGTGFDTAWQWVASGNFDYDWWEYVYEDAATIGLKITGFDLDRSRHAEGELTHGVNEVVRLILDNHGKDTDTYKLALEWLADKRKSWETSQGTVDLATIFTRDLLELYSIMLQNEYEHMSSEEYCIEQAEANEWEFTADGELWS